MAVTSAIPAFPETAEPRAMGAADFGSIVRQHQAMVFSIAMNSTGDRARSEEIAQDVFLRLYENLSTIESAAHLKHWLRRVATNRCIDEIRRRGPIVEPLGESEDIADEGWAHDPLLDATLRRLITGLPELQRLSIILRYQEDLDPRDIARTLGVPVNTVKSHLHRGLRALRAKLQSSSRRRS